MSLPLSILKREFRFLTQGKHKNLPCHFPLPVSGFFPILPFLYHSTWYNGTLKALALCEVIGFNLSVSLTQDHILYPYVGVEPSTSN